MTDEIVPLLDSLPTEREVLERLRAAEREADLARRLPRVVRRDDRLRAAPAAQPREVGHAG
jgi:hypothetical protein